MCDAFNDHVFYLPAPARDFKIYQSASPSPLFLDLKIIHRLEQFLRQPRQPQSQITWLDTLVAGPCPKQAHMLGERV